MNNAINARVVCIPEVIGYPTDMLQIGETPGQHLYFTTDEPIQDGDWCFAGMGYQLIKALNIYDFKFHYKNCIKIVASTDHSLGLPTIPITWIKDVYVPSNGSILDVVLELNFSNPIRATVEGLDPRTYMFMAEQDLPPIINGDWKLKLTPDNEVCIVGDRPIKRTEDNIPKEFILSQYDAKEWVDSIKPEHQETYNKKCSHTYSKAMNQQYPRLCVKCGTPEFEVTKMTWDEIRDSIKLPNNISYLDLHHIIEILKDDFNPPVKKLRL